MTTGAELPRVTAVICAYDYAGYVRGAVDSALMQDYPPALLDVVVIDDGSTDATPEVLAEAYASEPRVSLIRQENAGASAATNTGLDAVSGEVFALLDADDAWHRDHIRRAVELLRARPDVGLVHGDMDLIDANGNPLGAAYFAYNGLRNPPRGRILGELIRGPNFVCTSTIVARTAVLEWANPLPPQFPAQDWSMAVLVAERAAIERVEGRVADYRVHGSNRGAGAQGEKFYAKLPSRAAQQRWMLGHVALTEVSVPMLHDTVVALLANLRVGSLETDSLPTANVEVSSADRACSSSLATAAASVYATDPALAARLWVRAIAADPFNGEALANLAVAAERISRGGAPGLGVSTRGVVILAFADELVEQPDMLAGYAEAVDGSADVTLLVHLPEGDDRLAGAVVAAARALGLDRPESADVVLHECADPADLLRAPVRALYTRASLPQALSQVAPVDRITLDGLPRLLTTRPPMPLTDSTAQ